MRRSKRELFESIRALQRHIAPIPARTWVLVIGAMLVGCVFLAQRQKADLSAAEPDRYYHLYIAQTTATEGLVHSLPQVEDLRWGASFPEKEFFFHLVSALAYRLNGESGVILLVPLLASAIVLLVFLTNASVVSPRRAAAITIVCLFLSSIFYHRLLFLRPHLLAIGFYVLALYGCLTRKPWLVAVACALFALSYHALYVIAAPIGLCLLLGLAFKDNKNWKYCFFAGAIGLIAGILLNPYYPANLRMMFMVAGVADDAVLNRTLRAGVELIPEPAWDYFRHYFAFWALAAVAFFLVLRNRAKLEADVTLQHGFFLALLAAVFMGLAAISPRAVEYAVPSCALLAGQLTATLGPTSRKWSAVWLVGFLALQGKDAIHVFRRTDPFVSQAQLAMAALRALPEDSTGKKIYHCEWQMGSYVLYVRPDMRFVDLLDPHFLMGVDPKKTVLRYQINMGRRTDVYEVVTRAFGANYVLCANRNVVRAMNRDKRFKRLFPPQELLDQFPYDWDESPLLYVVSDTKH